VMNAQSRELRLSFVALCLFAALVCSRAAAGEEGSLAEKSADPNFVTLPYRSIGLAWQFIDLAVLRFICPRGYLVLDGAREVPCSQSLALSHEAGTLNFSKSIGADKRQTLDFVLVASPSGIYEVHLLGEITGVVGQKQNPDLVQIATDLESFIKQLISAPLGGPNDKLFGYQLSYVQADRAVAILSTLGYPVIEYQKAAGNSADQKTDNIFEQKIAGAPGTIFSRPAIIRMIDSEATSLVQSNDSTGGGGDSELTGGQRLSEGTDGAPQQRLLIVYDENDRNSLDKLLSLLQGEIDVPARQILIEALIIELDRDKLLDLGVDFKGKKDNYDFSFEGGGGLIQPFLFNFTQPRPKTLFEFMAKIRVLVDRGQATVLSRPSVFVLDGRQAKIKVGDNIPYTSELDISNGVVVSKNTYLKTGIILNLRPRAAADNSSVTFQVETIVSSPGPSRTLPDLGILIAPTVQSRQVQTLVRVANDTPFVIGGLIAQADQSSVVGLPGILNIPVLGRLFRKENLAKSRKEVIVLITPHIVASDDPTYAYSIPKDTRAAGAEDGRNQYGQRSLGTDAGEFCSANSQDDPIFKPIVLKGQNFQESLFDSFGSELFRNVYRLRSSDIFDLSFIEESTGVQQVVAKTQDDLARRISSSQSSEQYKFDADELERRLRKRLCADEQTDCRDKEPESTLLTLSGGGVPGEDVLVHHMMARIVEKLNFGACVPMRNVIFFSEVEDEGLDPKYLTEDESIRKCLEEGRTIVMAFPPQAPPNRSPVSSLEGTIVYLSQVFSYRNFLETCFEQDPDTVLIAEPGLDATSPFSPPSVELACLPVGTDYIQKLRDCNRRRDDGTWDWQAILLNTSFMERRNRNTLSLLQSVLALDRLLDLNDSDTFPRTLKAFHAGRELVLPTREDLETRRHLIDHKTAQLFYETLDYYYAFTQAYVQKLRSLARERPRLEDLLDQ
jgi:Flp pilus assembly secretin CpaC